MKEKTILPYKIFSTILNETIFGKSKLDLLKLIQIDL